MLALYSLDNAVSREDGKESIEYMSYNNAIMTQYIHLSPRITSSSLNWFETLKNFLSSIGLQRSIAEPRIYVMRGTDNQPLKTVLAWVDDIILFGDNNKSIERSLLL